MEILTIIKGFVIGGSMLIPGVSGGTMAMILKLYKRLITSISSFMKHKKESILFLLQFCIGAGAAWLILSGPMVALNGTFPKQMACFDPVQYLERCVSGHRPGAGIWPGGAAKKRLR